ncbi:hypothetical protein P46FS4_115 [Salmonella phage P46FS4]|uniref:Uncharacterized protein n=3 Tax=Agtrevirus TaxID=2169532 RepID=A0A6G6XTV8_9CAUD|nr:hypothetical protein G178_gp112 [Salmonella phage SKML-39]YP_009882743.1 hypothetical protein HYP84_gp004 [Shigella phage MK-13]YP_009889454.1 hypothetical protein HYQ39_gp115 [Salmonella phage P46FS4]WKM80414.1 hypothetical protein [Salmonella phage SW16-7]AFU64455.1 hypothetical protein [Salmonella phage SKML-39]QBJ04237.1 hypothetical protein MK13_00004 [Shigella phage MK-13]QIG62181.1 hypothetical protein P46FS4_115 [Salmonella phage P46FS4]
MKRYLKLTTVLESIIEYFIMQHLRADNMHLDGCLTYDHKIIVHSVEVLDDDLMVANVEHCLFDESVDAYCQPRFAKVELTTCWPPEMVFNIDVES